MRIVWKTGNSSRSRWALLFPPIVLWLAVLSLAGCGRSQPTEEAKRFQLQGEVVAVDVLHHSLVVNHGDIPGFMSAMTMPYDVADPRELEGLGPGDQIRAELVVVRGVAHLEKIAVVAKAKAAAPLASPPRHAP
ncbi:MAG: copper-binding protein [Candidatus Acidiferrales bacterium]|jgi:protein SCO1/2